MLFFKKNNISFETTLHIAPETQLVKLFASLSKKYICGDIDTVKYKRIPNIIYLDITSIPFKNKFNLIFASHILEHVLHDRKAMTEIYNALQVNGRFITLVPQKLKVEKTYEDDSIVTEEDRKKHFGQKDHVRWYGLDFSRRLKEAGFYVKIHYVESIEEAVDNMVYDEKIQLADNEERKNFAFQEKDIIYECIKRV